MIFCVYLLIGFFAIIMSCGDGLDEDADLARLAAFREEALLLIGEASCSEIGECRSLPFGAKPCGGPREYLIYSIINSDTLKFREKVDEYNSWNEVLNKRYGYMSDCMLVEEPQLVCLDGKCVDRNEIGGNTG